VGSVVQSVSEDLAGEEESSNTGLFGFARRCCDWRVLACMGIWSQ